jgi:hypothetical protein
MRQAMRKKIPGTLSRNILLHENALLHLMDLTKATLANMGGKTTILPPHNSGLAFGDLHLLEPMKMRLGRQKRQIYYEHRRCVLNCKRSQDKPFILLALVTCQEDKKLCYDERRMC